MNLSLIRNQFRADGIFGRLLDENGGLIAYTLEHSYPDDKGGFVPKIPNGEFVCQRGPHILNGMTSHFETFEITGVEGHTNLLFHWGNFNADSEGCILLGDTIYSNSGNQMVTNSRKTFERFMALQDGVTTFNLEVCGS